MYGTAKTFRSGGGMAIIVPARVVQGEHLNVGQVVQFDMKGTSLNPGTTKKNTSTLARIIRLGKIEKERLDKIDADKKQEEEKLKKLEEAKPIIIN